MKILPVYALSYNSISRPHNDVSHRVKLSGLSKDTVSFGYLFESVPQDMQIYRSIGKSEFEKLMNGESVSTQGYVTSSPKGWGTREWVGGYSYGRDVENTYFVTFKKGRFLISSRRDDEFDTRYGINRSYSLEDVENIRKGVNAHGELVWSQDFENDKIKDIQDKKLRITILIDSLKQNNKSDNISLIGELLSYSKEFPQIAHLYSDFADFSNTHDVNNLVELIDYSGGIEYLPIYDRCLKSFIEGTPVYLDIRLDYLRNNGGDYEFNLLFDSLDKNIFGEDALANAFSNLADENKYKLLYDKLSQTPKGLYILSAILCRKLPTNNVLNEARKVLSDCYNYQQRATELNEAERFKLTCAVDTAISILARAKDKKAIPIIEKFLEGMKYNICYKYDAEDAIEQILKVHSS